MKEEKLIALLEKKNFHVEDILGLLKKNCKPFLKDLSRSQKPLFLWRGAKYGKGEMSRIRTRSDRRPKDMPYEIHQYTDDAFYNMFRVYARSKAVFGTGEKSGAEGYGRPYLLFPIGKYTPIWSPEIKDFFVHLDNNSLLDFEVSDYGVEDDWEREYGPEGNGEWTWKNGTADAKDRDDAATEFAKEWIDSEGWDDFDDYDEALEHWESVIYDEMEWEPLVTYEDFWMEYSQEKREDIEYEISNVIRTYKKGDIVSAIRSEHEIMIDCKEYYLVDPDWEKDLKKHWKFLTNPRITIGQLDLPFGKKK